MIKAVIFLAICAAGMYLFLNPGDVAGLQEAFKDAAHQAGQFVVENTK